MYAGRMSFVHSKCNKALDMQRTDDSVGGELRKCAALIAGTFPNGSGEYHLQLAK